jgi:hypothetical protein
MKHYFFHVKCGGHAARLNLREKIGGLCEMICENCGIIGPHDDIWVSYAETQEEGERMFRDGSKERKGGD